MTLFTLNTHIIDCITGTLTVTGSAETPPLFAELHAETEYFKLEVLSFAGGEFTLSGRLPYSAKIKEVFTLRVFFQGTNETLISSSTDVKLKSIPGPAEPDNSISLSICIPTYMRGPRVTQTVKQILESERQDLEVVVNDNGSDDDTLKLLAEIDDDRLKVFSNDQNYGPIANFQIALAQGRGQYVFLHSDEDIILIEELSKFIDFLKENPSIHAGLVSFREFKTGKETKVFAPGKESQLAASSGFTYLGGFFYKRSALELDFLYSEYDTPAFLYPFENLSWKLSQEGSFCKYSPVVCQRGRNEKSYYPKYEGRHFNHPVNLIDQYLKRCAYFSDLAAENCTEEDQKVAFGHFRDLMMRQNFFFSYRQPHDEKLEILNLVQRSVPEVMSHFIVKSLMAQVIGDQLSAQGSFAKAAEWYREAIEHDGRNAEAGFKLAEITDAEGLEGQPAHIYQHIIESTPKRWAFLLHVYAGFKQRNLSSELAQVKALLEAEEAQTPNHILATLQ